MISVVNSFLLPCLNGKVVNGEDHIDPVNKQDCTPSHIPISMDLGAIVLTNQFNNCTSS